MSIVISPTAPPPIKVVLGGSTAPIISTPEQRLNITVPTGPPGPPGPPGKDGAAAQWEEMTQAEYDALPNKDPNTLYVIIG